MPLGYLLITELFQPTKGGTPVWYDAVYRRLGGKEVHIVTADVPGAREHDAASPNSVHRLTLRRHWWLKPESLGMYAKLLAQSAGVAARHRIDVVHAARALPEGLVAWLVARALRRPVVVYSHGEEITTWTQAAKRRAMAFVYRHADRVIANSAFTREALLALGVTPERLRVIYPGVDLERFQPMPVPADLRAGLGLGPASRLVLSVGRLYRRKGFDQVIRGLPRLLASGLDVHYAIVGIGADWDYLGDLARETGVGERVHRLGLVPEQDLPLWYNAADVFVMPNREVDRDTEGFGIVYVEAAACGKPAIAGLTGGTGSAVVDGVTGLRVDGTSVEAVAGALERLLRDTGLAARMGEAGYRRARSEFSWEHVTAATVAVDRELVGAR